MTNALRLLLTLFTILSSTTICNASTQEVVRGVVFGKIFAPERETNFSTDFIAPKTTDDFLRLADNLDVSTARNGAVFYSGGGNRELAEAFARQNGRTTLEMTPGGQFLDDLQLFGPNSPLTPDQATQVWSRLSQRFAAEASGNATGFVRGARAEGIFNTVEFPALRTNPNVTNVITGGN